VGFSIRIVPGLRVGVSARGVRTSIGPRAARLHVGGGRTGVSSGFGPVGFYTSIGGGRRGSGGAGAQAAYRRQLAAQRRQVAQADKLAVARQLAEAFSRILNLHRVDFPPAHRPIAPEPPAPDRTGIHQTYEQQALAGIGMLNRSERRVAKQHAEMLADAEVSRLWQHLKNQQAQWQQALDRNWNLLCANDPDTVLSTLAVAFEDNEAPSAPVGVIGTEVALVLVVSPPDITIPDQLPGHTAAGNLSLKRITATERADFYKHFVCGQVLVTLRETFAVAPAIESARVVVLRNDGRDPYGRPVMPCLAAVKITRDSLVGVRWHDADAVAILDATAREKLLAPKGRTQQLSPVPLAREPDIEALIAAVDLEDLAG
jgi:hypothetical protein